MSGSSQMLSNQRGLKEKVLIFTAQCDNFFAGPFIRRVSFVLHSKRPVQHRRGLARAAAGCSPREPSSTAVLLPQGLYRRCLCAGVP